MRSEDGNAFCQASFASVETTGDAALLRRSLVSALADRYGETPSDPMPARMQDLLDRLGEIWGDSPTASSAG